MTRRIVVSVIAVVVIVIGGLTAIGGAALLLLFRSAGRVESGVERISTPTRALVTKAGDVTGVSAAPSWVGRPTLEVTLTDPSGGASFVGVGPAAAVDAYLADVQHDVVTDVEITPFALNTARQNGTRTPAPPGDQTFWVAKGTSNSGTTTVSWSAQDGEYRVVIMNMSAEAGLDTNARFAVAVPGMGNVGLIVLIIGLVLLALGVVLLVIALAGRARTAASGGTRPPAPAVDPQTVDPAGIPDHAERNPH